MGVEGVTPGTAFTLITSEDRAFAWQLIRHLRASDQPVSEDLIAIGGRGEPGGVKTRSDNVVLGDTRTHHFSTRVPEDRTSTSGATGTALSGFVRAAGSYSSTNTSPRNNSAVQSRKQSRWS